MKLYKIFIAFFLISLLVFGCSSKRSDGDAATNDSKDAEIQQYNIGVQKDQTKNRFPCDTIALKEYILSNYERGTYLVDFDRTYTYNVPKSAVIYFKDGGDFILAVIAKSKQTERNIRFH